MAFGEYTSDDSVRSGAAKLEYDTYSGYSIIDYTMQYADYSDGVMDDELYDFGKDISTFLKRTYDAAITLQSDTRESRQIKLDMEFYANNFENAQFESTFVGPDGESKTLNE